MKMNQWELKKACLENNWKQFIKELQKINLSTTIEDDIVKTCIFWGRLKYFKKLVEHGIDISYGQMQLVYDRKYWHFFKYILEQNPSIVLINQMFTILCYSIIDNFPIEKGRREVIDLVIPFVKIWNTHFFEGLCKTKEICLLEKLLNSDAELLFEPYLKYSWPVNDFLYNNRQFCTEIIKTMPYSDLKKIAFQPRFLQCPIETILKDVHLLEFVRWRISQHSKALISVFPVYVIENIISFCLDTSSVEFHKRIEIIISVQNHWKKSFSFLEKECCD